MATAGESIENPVTGERVAFLQTAAETAGELLAIDVFMRPAGRIAAAHVHPRQEERFTVRAGTIQMTIAGHTRTATTGEHVVIAPTTKTGGLNRQHRQGALQRATGVCPRRRRHD
jgi:quercetin dioxygenase-like cupin family protein